MRVLPLDAGHLTAIAAVLAEHDFQTTRQAVRMQMGPDINWKPECVYSRIAGNMG